ncbi:MAG: multidrug ABC transporter substrate-binding protein [Candidatus Schekmanbacteria bacterium RIFCSPHIGHO2_02_FULL_38_11]|uniref:Multidrug ABC transporter substrate-binding protein n=1 Tax=Candidatus Schekmanbacteria bacterium RIFCSPLOWO2_12_FULL_38_15 TaxID=1817883 RepID=A0A1F7SFF3_9BACT|nr:MAG: multidrug ABC transporter substrate-binding protein [Candidatus Schekmanbacteria bacterium GWA2_38_9]OGL48420.1 MAG: multidrug ABC transporter substrate-binding protein [Candidatus Schekmanbacteria bacterium RIFCSPLOWO2_02_FULL_38_14]OGL51907.1 MAG: multidrug ABC transporter substrate-binding protein [Candidatus Schekmanbacteria bacterium RIFCSPLOWO2_12_FULL_38_15]OGL52035.1 MAG: multidrug ABC transporter substrate-binding protein [Candidatus Schekmanbacteria bacterium RIFCSPHIGHO2_02_FU
MINIPSTIKIALRALRVNKMRSALTMLGIIIGVSAVIAMLAVGAGANQKIAEQVASLGSNLLMVVPGTTTTGGVRTGMGNQPTLTMGDAEAIEKECSAVLNVAPSLNGTAQIVYSNQNWSTLVSGTTTDVLKVRDWSLASGREFTEQDIKNATKVCILGQTVIDNLFGNTSPIGKIIRIKRVSFKVIGILQKKGQNLMGQDQDDTIFVPVTTAQKRLFGTTFPGMIRTIVVKAKNVESLETAEKQITELLRQRHSISSKQDDDFSVRNLTEMMEFAKQATRIMALLLGSIASVSLLVGGIGIMNIMLVSVTERTREIGIRMAIGAKTWDIRTQFIIEAVTLSLIGGIVGIILGITISKIVSTFAGWPTIVSPFSIMLAFGFSGLVGISFGFYPAYKASQLNPIDALRYE